MQTQGMASSSPQAISRLPSSSVARTQGAFYLATGIWPLISLRSFEAVTGPKPEGWLVKTVGCLVSVIGGALLSSAQKARVTPEVRALAIGSAASLALIDIAYAAKRRIAPVYLLDAMAEVGLIAAWAVAGRSRAAR